MPRVVVDNPDNSLPNHKITKTLSRTLSRFCDDPVDFLKTLFHHAKGSSWRSYDNYIGQQLYTPGLTDFQQKTLENPSLAKKIHEMALLQLEREASGFTSAKDLKNREEELHAWLREKAESMGRYEMICTFDHKSVLRFLVLHCCSDLCSDIPPGRSCQLAWTWKLTQQGARASRKTPVADFLAMPQIAPWLHVHPVHLFPRRYFATNCCLWW